MSTSAPGSGAVVEFDSAAGALDMVAVRLELAAQEAAGAGTTPR